MAKLQYQDCVARAFEPLLKASGRADLATRLRVFPPPEEQRKQQFAKFGSMKDDGLPPFFLPNGGFFFPFHMDDTQCFAFSSFLDELDLRNSLERWLREHDATLEFLDQATFLFLSFHASNYYSLRPQFQTKRKAEEIVALAEFSEYEGHNVDDLIEYFRPTYVVSVPRDSLISEMDPYVVATEILAIVPNLRSPIVDDEFAAEVYNLLAIPSIRSENLFLSLTSTRWRYAYLELFRVVEATLYLPWLLDFASTFPDSVNIRELYTSLREKLDWREAKGRSIERVFSTLDEDRDLDKLERACSNLVSVLASGDTKRASLGKRIYKIRNQLVHPEDFTDGSLLDVSEEEFRMLGMYLCAVIARLYSEYDRYLRPTSY